MSRSRRAALAGILGSGGLLAVETLGVSRTDGERDAPIAAVDDADAYLGLLADGGVQSGGVLFADAGRQSAPAAFAVANQLHDTVSVTLGSRADGLQFRRGSFATCPCDGHRTLELGALEPGTARTVAVSPGEPGTPVTDAIRISAETTDGATTADAERTVALAPAAVAVIRMPTHVIVLEWCEGALYLSILDRETDETVRCTRVSRAPSPRRESLIVVIDRTPAVDAATASVADATSDARTIPEPFRNGFDETQSPASGTVWTAPGVSAAVRDRDAGVAGNSSLATGTAAIAIDFGDDGWGTDDPTVVSVTLPADG